MTIDLAPFVDFASEMAPQNLVRWCGKEALSADVWESLAADVRRRTADLDWAPLQRHFIDQLPSGKGDLVFGTIDATNRPSIRTAIKVGRADLGGWSFVPIRREISV